MQFPLMDFHFEVSVCAKNKGGREKEKERNVMDADLLLLLLLTVNPSTGLLNGIADVLA